MAHPVQAHPNLSLHLTDRALNSLVSSASSTASSSNHDLNATGNISSNAHALESLTLAANTAFESAKRLGLGLPQRMMVETMDKGPIVLHSYMNPAAIVPQGGARRGQDTMLTGMAESGGSKAYGTAVAINGHANKESEAEELSVEAPPLLIATVVGGSAEDLSEARRAAVKLEKIGRGVQREWVRGQERHADAAGDDVGEG